MPLASSPVGAKPATSVCSATTRAASSPAARRTLIFNTLSGLALMAALRSALIGHGALAIAGFLSLGFVMHLAELWFRHRAFRRVSAPRPD